MQTISYQGKKLLVKLHCNCNTKFWLTSHAFHEKNTVWHNYPDIITFCQRCSLSPWFLPPCQENNWLKALKEMNQC